jgi:proteasome lid subunit RPN8/RPN11
LSAARDPLPVVVSPTALRALLSAHDAAVAAEPCALLIGRAESRGLRVLEARPTPNVHPSPAVAFTVEPEALAATSREARARGLAVVGAWHGHLRGPAWLSRADEAGLRRAGVAAEGTERAPFTFLVTGRGAGRATVLRGFVVRRSGAVAETPVFAARD